MIRRKKALPDALFIEYVDGAGYFASLNGDLRTLLSMPDTHSFFQIRSAPIRLRRSLQAIGFLTPLEIEHAILRVGQNRKSIYDLLLTEGYSESEVSRSLSQALEQGIMIQSSAEELDIHPDRRPNSRRYLLLDLAAINSQPLTMSEVSGKLLLPGYGPFYGLRQNELIRLAIAQVPSLAEDWQQIELAFDDLQWWLDKRVMISGA